MKILSLRMLLLATIVAPMMVHAADPCGSFKWNVSREIALFGTTPVTLGAGVKPDAAPRIEIGRLYETRLASQSAVTLAAAPSKKMLDDGAHAGLFRLRVAAAGSYRISIDAGYWVDVVAGGKAVASTDFNGETQCRGPRKIVVYALPADTDLLLQFSAADEAGTRFAVTQVVPDGP